MNQESKCANTIENINFLYFSSIFLFWTLGLAALEYLFITTQNIIGILLTAVGYISALLFSIFIYNIVKGFALIVRNSAKTEEKKDIEE